MGSESLLGWPQSTRQLLADDYTHPSDKGNEVIARVLADLGYAPLA